MTSESLSCLELYISGGFHEGDGLEPRKRPAVGFVLTMGTGTRVAEEQSCAIFEFIKQRPDKAELNWGWGMVVQPGLRPETCL